MPKLESTKIMMLSDGNNGSSAIVELIGKNDEEKENAFIVKDLFVGVNYSWTQIAENEISIFDIDVSKNPKNSELYLGSVYNQPDVIILVYDLSNPKYESYSAFEKVKLENLGPLPQNKPIIIAATNIKNKTPTNLVYENLDSFKEDLQNKGYTVDLINFPKLQPSYSNQITNIFRRIVENIIQVKNTFSPKNKATDKTNKKKPDAEPIIKEEEKKKLNPFTAEAFKIEYKNDSKSRFFKFPFSQMRQHIKNDLKNGKKLTYEMIEEYANKHKNSRTAKIVNRLKNS